jgi:TonB family protein
MTYHLPEFDFLPRRTLAVGTIIAAHLLVVYLLATGLLHTVIEHEPPVIHVAPFVKSDTPVDPVKLAPTPVTWDKPHVPPPDIPVVTNVDTGHAIETPVSADGPVDSRGAAPAAPPALRILGKNYLPDTEDYYPPQEIRLGITGAAYVRVCVDERGSRHGEPALEESSGNGNLDAAALNMARHGRYARALEGAQPVPTCFRFRIVFRQSGGGR